MDNIKKIELWPYQTELEQLVRENPRVLAVWGSLTGKTFMSIKVCADHLFDHPNSTVLLVSPIIPTQSTLIYVQSVTQEAMRLKPWWKQLWRDLQQRLHLIHGRFLLVPPVPHQLRGLSTDLVVIDDADMLSNNAVLTIAELAADKIVIFSRATSKHDSFGRTHWLYDLATGNSYKTMQVPTSHNPAAAAALSDFVLHNRLSDSMIKRCLECLFVDDPIDKRGDAVV